MNSAIILFQILILRSYSQSEYSSLSESVPKLKYKVVFLNPGFEIQIPQSWSTTINIHLGIGYSGSYPNLTTGFNSGFQYLISPFADVQYRVYYSRKKRLRKNKDIGNYSGSFIVCRGLIRGREIASNFIRTSNLDYSVGIGWGFQQYKNRVGWSFSVAPYYYFDDKGNAGFFPLIPEINIGYLLGKKN